MYFFFVCILTILQKKIESDNFFICSFSLVDHDVWASCPSKLFLCDGSESQDADFSENVWCHKGNLWPFQNLF